MMRTIDELITAARACEPREICLPTDIYRELLEAAQLEARRAAYVAALWQSLAGPEIVEPAPASQADEPKAAAPEPPKIARAYVSPPGAPVDDAKLAQLASRFVVRGLPAHLHAAVMTVPSSAAPAQAEPPQAEPVAQVEPVAQAEPAPAAVSGFPPGNEAPASAPETAQAAPQAKAEGKPQAEAKAPAKPASEPARLYAHFPQKIAAHFPEDVIISLRAGDSPLRAWREYRKATGGELAAALQVDSSRVYQLDKAMRRGVMPPEMHIGRICAHLKIERDWFVPSAFVDYPQAVRPIIRVSKHTAPPIVDARPFVPMSERKVRVDVVGVTATQYQEILRAMGNTPLLVRHVVYNDRRPAHFSAEHIVANLAGTAPRVLSEARRRGARVVRGAMTAMVAALREVEQQTREGVAA